MHKQSLLFLFKYNYTFFLLSVWSLRQDQSPEVQHFIVLFITLCSATRMQIINLMCSFVMSLALIRCSGISYSWNFSHSRKGERCFPFNYISRFKYLHSECVWGWQFLRVVFSYLLSPINKKIMNFLWQFLAVQEKDVPRL